MKSKVLVSTAIIALFSAIFCIFIVPLNAQGNAGTVTSKGFVINTEITLDGKYDEEEWNDVNPRSFTLYEFSDPTIEREIEIASVHNDTTLYIWISVDEPEPRGEFYLTFQTTNGPIITDHTGPLWSAGNDVKHIVSNNDTSDLLWFTDNLNVAEDSSKDFEGKCYTRSGGFDFEMAFPLDSGDTDGGDVSLMEGDSIYMFPTYITNFNDEVFSLIQSTDGVWEQINLDVDEYSYWKIPSYSIPILLFSALAVSMILIFKYSHQNRHLKK